MQKGELEFPFDINSFMSKVAQMEKSVSNISSRMDKFGKTMISSVSKGIMFATAKIKLLVGAFKGVTKNIPEIGQSFEIASDIISKEFFFPIRQEITPYLQKMLDWVRDHRSLFAKWGSTVASIIKVVISVGKQLWEVFTNVARVLTDTLQRGLGTSFKSIDEFINILSVKVAVITLLLGDLLSAMLQRITPTFEYITSKGAEVLGFFGDLLSSWLNLNENGDSLFTVLDKIYNIFDKIIRIIGDSLSGFLEGLLDPLKKLMTPLDEICDSFQRLLSIFGDDNDGIKGMFKWLGGFTGNVLLVAFEELAWTVGTIVDGIMTLVKAGQLVGDVFKGDWEALTIHSREIGDIWGAWLDRTQATGNRQFNALVEGVTGGSVDTSITTNPKTGQPINMRFGSEWIPRKYEYNGKIGKYDSWVGDRGIVLPTKDGKSYYRYQNDNVDDMKILEEIREGNYTNMHDGFISKDGKIVKLDPNDNIYAFKEFGSKPTNISIPMNMTFNVTVSEGNAEKIGRDLGMSIRQSIADKIAIQQMVRGY